MLKHDFVKPTYPKKFINNYSASMRQKLNLRCVEFEVFLAVGLMIFFAFLGIWCGGGFEGIPGFQLSTNRKWLTCICFALMVTSPFLSLAYYGLLFPTLYKNNTYYREHLHQVTNNLLWKYDADLKLYNHNVLTALVEHCKAKNFIITKLDNITHRKGIKFARYDYAGVDENNMAVKYRLNLEIPPKIDAKTFNYLFY